MGLSTWQATKQVLGNWADTLGTTLGLPETGLSERIAGGPTVNTAKNQAYVSENPSTPMQSTPNASYNPPNTSTNNGPVYSPAPQNQNQNQNQNKNTTKADPNAMVNIGGVNKTVRSAQAEGLMDEFGNMIQSGADSQQKAAEAAAEARRNAAAGKYNAQVGISQNAKAGAKESYDWLVSTIGSNKQDLLEQVALNDKQGTADYQLQNEKTTQQYDKAKQDILSTYRDLQTAQEKILRGSGMGSSSRSQEAELKLTNLLGKDMSQVSTNEADSLAMIGNALTSFKEKTVQTQTSIEREASGKLDSAAVDYNNQIRAIDNNLTLSASEREDAYANAEIQLAQDTQGINQWATGLKAQQAQTQAAMQEKLNGFVSDMLDSNALLGSNLNDKKTATNTLLTEREYTPMETNPTTTDPSAGVYQKAKASYKDKASLDEALASRQITPSDYSSQLNQIQMASSGSTPTAMVNPMQGTTIAANSAARGVTNRDTLLGTLLA